MQVWAELILPVRKTGKNGFSALADEHIITNRIVFAGDTVQIIAIKSNA
jgi:hypothetical protein